MNQLKYPFDSINILKRKKRIKKELLKQNDGWLSVNIAILGGSSTNEIIQILELFLLDNGILPNFYESNYGQYWQDAMFLNEGLQNFSPDIIFIHTSFYNLQYLPSMKDSTEKVEMLLETQYQHFESMWNQLAQQYQCSIIQNNFERPPYRLLGNQDVAQPQGWCNFVSHINQKLYEYAQTNSFFFVHDIDYLSARYGLNAWSDPTTWYLYKYCLAFPAIPEFAYNLSNIIKSLYGKNKKAIITDLDNTLWGGVIGEEGVDGIVLGPEFPSGQAYLEFQKYLKRQEELGVIFCINSKNDIKIAREGLEHPHAIFNSNDFVAKRINWKRKDENIHSLAQELNLSEDSFVFLDDNPSEREIVRQGAPSVTIPELQRVDDYIRYIDQAGFFEVTRLSKEDQQRDQMYKANQQRQKTKEHFTDYTQYLESLHMCAQIQPFEEKDLSRIIQLINKTNQFNLTTKRYVENDIQFIQKQPNILSLAGRLSDRFGDNGLVSAVIGHKEKEYCYIDIWVMSCRVFQRNFEQSMMNEYVRYCEQQKVNYLIGCYVPSAKNHIVKNFYAQQGFQFWKQEDDRLFWKLCVPEYQPQKTTILINGE